MIRSDVIFELILDLAEKEGLQVTFKNSAKGTLLGGAIFFLFSLFMGPIGFILGGIFGGIFAYCRSAEYRPLQQVIKEDISSTEKEMIVDKVRSVIGEVGPQDLATLLLFVNNTPILKSSIISTLQNTVTSRLG
ncbi:protein C19orf12 homolog [Lepeophtheirus salmonis]|uniref:Uncharacterized protein n=2 Tax=Lepeophtheirus salmonis TaxID=72036 RepID=A0A0K2TK28_LEPSM|nr:protein C19orf12 homolog [Lepeophtheirus salmonis]